MSQVPARLVYENSSNNDEVIGSFQPQDVTSGNISTFTVDENARNYTKVIIEGGPTLEDNMPTTLSEFGTSEPEIRVEIDSDFDGTWETRARVYPEESGTTNDRGRYKNKNLWGFKKYYGEDSVNTGTLTSTDLTAAVDALLPSGYTAVYPGDITAPSISEYSYRGARQQGFNELQREYNHFIFFTTATDGGGDYIVRVQPKGYGGEEQSYVRGQDAYTYNYWKKKDLSNVISRVQVVGKDSNGDKVDLTFQAGSDTGDPEVDTYLTSLDDPDRNRFKRLHIDQTINSTDAQTIAENFLQPTGTQHGKIEAALIPQSTLNDSVGILDNERGIDDIFTVVKQKDFFHEGITQFSFEFEQEATDEQRDKWREHDNERAKVYPEGQTDVGGQNVNATTETVTDSYDDFGNDNHDHTNNDSTSDSNATQFAETLNATAQTSSLANGAFDSISGSVSYNGNAYQIAYTLETTAGFGAEFIVEISVGGTVKESYVTKTNNGGNIESQFSGLDNIDGQTVEFLYVNKSGGSVDVTPTLVVQGEAEHDHTVPISNTNNNSTGGNNDINTNDATAGNTESLDATGSTDSKNINTATEDDTSRG